MKIKIIFVLSIIILMLTSCDKNDPEATNLSFRITWALSSEHGDTINRLITSFNNSQDDIYVTILAGNEDLEETRDTLMGEETPDLLVLPYRYVKYFGSAGFLLEVDELIADDIDNHYESILEMARVDNSLYGVPWVGHSMSILYNETILEAAGVNPELITDFDTFADALEMIETNTSKSGIGLVGANHHDISWMTTQFIHSFGGTLVNEDKSMVTINSESAKAGLDYYINVLGNYAQEGWESHTGIEVMDSFRNEEVGFEIQGPWGITDIWKSGNPFTVGTISFSDLGGYSEVGPLMLCIKNNIEESKLESVQSFIDYMSSNPAMELIMNGEYSPKNETFYPFRVPVRKDMNDLTFFIMFPEFVNFMDGFENPSINTPCPLWTEVLELYYQPSLHEVIIGNLSIDDFLTLIETEGNKILEP